MQCSGTLEFGRKQCGKYNANFPQYGKHNLIFFSCVKCEISTNAVWKVDKMKLSYKYGSKFYYTAILASQGSKITLTFSLLHIFH